MKHGNNLSFSTCQLIRTLDTWSPVKRGSFNPFKIHFSKPQQQSITDWDCCHRDCWLVFTELCYLLMSDAGDNERQIKSNQTWSDRNVNLMMMESVTVIWDDWPSTITHHNIRTHTNTHHTVKAKLRSQLKFISIEIFNALHTYVKHSGTCLDEITLQALCLYHNN